MSAANRPYTAFLTSHFSLLTARVALCALLGLTALGCSQTNLSEQASRAEGLDTGTFLHEHLPQQAMVSVSEGYRALLLLAEPESEAATFEERAAELERRGIIRPAWKLSPDDPLDKGTAAYMVMQIIDGERGVNALVWGNLGIADRRYALRDLVYMGLMDQASEYRYIAGGELLNLMGKADEYMARRGRYEAEPVNLREELESATTQPAGETASDG